MGRGGGPVLWGKAFEASSSIGGERPRLQGLLYWAGFLG